MTAEVEALLDMLDSGHTSTSERAAALIRAQAEEIARLREQIDAIADIFAIGSAARSHGIILTNVQNANRRSDCLSAIEREFFTKSVGDEDGECGEECSLNWGSDPIEYVKQFRTAQIEAAARQEPVAWLIQLEGMDGSRITTAITDFKAAKSNCDFGEPVPLYAAPAAGDAVSVKLDGDFQRVPNALLEQANARIDELERQLVTVAQAEWERIAAHFEQTHRELWTPAIADEIRALATHAGKEPGGNQ